MRQCVLTNVYGGKGSQINDFMELFKALKEDEHLTKEVMVLLKDPKVTAILKDQEKRQKILDFVNRLEPGFCNEIPKAMEKISRLGLV